MSSINYTKAPRRKASSVTKASAPITIDELAQLLVDPDAPVAAVSEEAPEWAALVQHYYFAPAKVEPTAHNSLDLAVRPLLPIERCLARLSLLDAASKSRLKELLRSSEKIGSLFTSSREASSLSLSEHCDWLRGLHAGEIDPDDPLPPPADVAEKASSAHSDIHLLIGLDPRHSGATSTSSSSSSAAEAISVSSSISLSRVGASSLPSAAVAGIASETSSVSRSAASSAPSAAAEAETSSESSSVSQSAASSSPSTAEAETQIGSQSSLPQTRSAASSSPCAAEAETNDESSFPSAGSSPSATETETVSVSPSSSQIRIQSAVSPSSSAAETSSASSSPPAETVSATSSPARVALTNDHVEVIPAQGEAQLGVLNGSSALFVQEQPAFHNTYPPPARSQSQPLNFFTANSPSASDRAQQDSSPARETMLEILQEEELSVTPLPIELPAGVCTESTAASCGAASAALPIPVPFQLRISDPTLELFARLGADVRALSLLAAD
eukprot:CAMPEP_0174244406 /NCGR_PEP_ID=MMETSP0417-20130205/35185_1 /TAXON_ID=242541 /ORGANISM="Mayorella sp, Strain BSH-02190019" /LENGTH=500 /DNA_ID=CAMNT_0015324089 /DNA_START=32 /DNA_END=1531 /DNA_ORIENTATION=+